ncbi:MAG: FAD-dependent oxidoreductase [Rhodothermales bacterium]|nr:FAD-dependent oxidoreductase [Rhodothermales bacterium]
MPFFSDRERRTVEALAEVYIEGEDVLLTPREIAAAIDRHLGRVRSNRTQSLRLILLVVEHVLPRLAWPPSWRPFSRMPVDARRRLVERCLANPRRRGPWRDLARVRTLFALGYYSDERVQRRIGFVPVRERPKYRPEHLEPLPVPAVHITEPETSTMRCDVCVIGSGAAGAVVAHHAAAQGRDVLLLEEGPYVPVEALGHDEAAMTALLYKEGGLQTTVDLDMAILQGQCLGGTTVINNAICFDVPRGTAGAFGTTGELLDRWDALGARLDRDRLAESFRQVRATLGIGPLLDVQDEDLPPIDGPNAEAFRAGWEQRGLPAEDAGLFEKNYARCIGCGHCNFGCPYGRKRSMLETYVPAAVEAGARVLVGCHARGVASERANGRRRATAVRCRLADGRALRVEADAVVVACGAIGSSVQLMRSGVRRNVGTRFSFNAATPVFARFPGPVHAWDGVQMARYVDAGDVLLETLFNPPMTCALALPGTFRAHYDRMRAYDRLACAGVLIGTAPNGRVKRSAFFRRTFGPVHYRMTDRDLARMRRGIGLLAETFFAAGAEEVFPATFADLPLGRDRYADDPAAVARLLEEHVRRPEDLTLSSAHPQGGNPMSDAPAAGVVDSGFRVHGFENLFVCDASVFPTTVGINPQLTVMALADYFGRSGVL